MSGWLTSNPWEPFHLQRVTHPHNNRRHPTPPPNSTSQEDDITQDIADIFNWDPTHKQHYHHRNTPQLTTEDYMELWELLQGLRLHTTTMDLPHSATSNTHPTPTDPPTQSPANDTNQPIEANTTTRPTNPHHERQTGDSPTDCQNALINQYTTSDTENNTTIDNALQTHLANHTPKEETLLLPQDHIWKP